MGNFEPFMIDDLIIIQQDIKINVARSLVDDLFSTKSIFNALKLIQKCDRLKSSFNLIGISYCHVTNYRKGGIPSRYHCTEKPSVRKKSEYMPHKLRL